MNFKNVEQNFVPRQVTEKEIFRNSANENMRLIEKSAMLANDLRPRLSQEELKKLDILEDTIKDFDMQSYDLLKNAEFNNNGINESSDIILSNLIVLKDDYISLLETLKNKYHFSDIDTHVEKNMTNDNTEKEISGDVANQNIKALDDAIIEIKNNFDAVVDVYPFVQNGKIVIESNLVKNNAIRALQSINKKDSLKYNNDSRKMILEALLEYDRNTISPYSDYKDKGSSLEIDKSYFRYQDAPISETQKRDMLGHIPENDSAKKYAYAFTNLTKSCPLVELQKMADEAIDRVIDVLSFYSVEAGPFCYSRTWFLWDISKQYYYELYPNETTTEYRNKSYAPFDFEIIDEIVYRHLGWEFYADYHERDGKQKVESAFQGLPQDSVKEIMKFLNTAPKKNGGSLSSHNLSLLGKLLYMVSKNGSEKDSISKEMSFRM